jgi:mannose-6-phosphate isomerase-like protein (cupin superfamily)
MNPITPYNEKRPWGEFTEFIKETPCTVKLIKVKAGESFSLQKHSKRDEFWHIISGSGIITLGINKSEIIPDSNYFVPKNTNHRIEALSEDVLFLEISFGEFNENDIVRLDDKYNRHTNNPS